MRSDFAAACKTAKSKIIIPPVPIERIRSVAARPQPGWSRRPFVAACAAIAAMVALGAGVAFGGKILSGIHIWLPPAGNATIMADRISFGARPTAESVREIVASAPFHLILPTGLPRGTRLRTIGTLSGAGRRIFMLNYEYPIATGPRRGFATVMLSGRSFPFTQTVPPFRPIGIRPVVVMRAHKPVRWFVGREEILVWSSLTAQQAARMKAAMAATTPEAALNETIAMTGEIIPIGTPQARQTAERYRQPGINGYLIDGKLISALVRVLPQNASATGTFIDVKSSPHRPIVVFYRTPGAPVKSFGGPVPTGTVFESVATESIRSVESVLQVVVPGSSRSVAAIDVAARYDFLVYAGSGNCDLVWTLPRVPGTLPIERYNVSRRTFNVINVRFNGC